MEGLSPRELCLIYRHLTLSELQIVALVNRTWCWNLWRETEQLELWIPRISEYIRDNNNFKCFRTHIAFKEIVRQRKLGYKSIQDVLNTLALIQSGADKLIDQHARGYWLSESYPELLSGKIMPMSSFSITKRMSEVDIVTGAAGCYFLWATSPDSNGDIRVGMSCMYGQWNNSRSSLVTGKLIDNNVVQYDGEWHIQVPNGRGKSYHPSGTLQLDGTFLMGQPHGEARLYREDGKTLQCEGMWQDGELHGNATSYHKNGVRSFVGLHESSKEINGTWYDVKGNIICEGDITVYAQLMEKQTAVLHQCTYPLTGDTYALQPWFTCETCFGESEGDTANMTIAGVCSACAIRCHKGHQLQPHPPSTFFCDCGSHDPRSVDCIALEPCPSGCTDCELITEPIVEPIAEPIVEPIAEP